MTDLTRRRLMGIGGAAVIISFAEPFPGTAKASPGKAAPARFADQFLDPAATVRPKARWWMPLALTEHRELAGEVAAMAAAGLGGVEICAMAPSRPVDTAAYGWGSTAWADRLGTALSAVAGKGRKADMYIGPLWPAAVPSITPDSAGASKELIYGRAVVQGGSTFDGEVPPLIEIPLTDFLGHTRKPGAPKLTAVVVGQIAAGGSPESKPVPLVPTSLRDVTALVRGGRITWTAPAGGTWVLVSLWSRGTGQAVEGATSPTAYVVDHYGAAGTDAVTRFWDDHVLTPRVRGLVRRAGGDLFEDSLELSFGLPWTDHLAEYFASSRGYSMTPYLPVLFIPRLHQFSGGSSPDSPPDFELTGAGNGARVRNDFYQVLTELYQRHHLDRLRDWAGRSGLRFRAQVAYGSVLEMSSSASHVDVPETEQLFFGDEIDGYRSMAGGAHMAGKAVLSTEVAPVVNVPLQDAYGVTWQDMLRVINQNFAGGVNQAVLHGFAYADAPGAAWPGWAPFAPLGNLPGFGEAWGPRQPTWRHMPDIVGYLARQQLILRAGRPSVDVAIYRHSYWEHAKNPVFADAGLRQSGYSYEFIGPAELRLPSATVSGGRLAPEGPGYQALVLNRQTTLTLDAARRILGHAQQGLAVIVIGPVPSSTPFFHNAAAQDAELQKLMRKLLACPRAGQISTEAELPAALAAKRAVPAAHYARSTELLNVHRKDGDTDYYYFFNPGTADVHVDVTLAGSGRPYRLDAWTGQTTPLAEWDRPRRGSISVRIDLAPTQTTMIAVTSAGNPAVRPGTADVHYRDQHLVVRSTTAGNLTVPLQDGRTAHATIAAVPPPISLERWTLAVDDWRPGNSATETRIVRHNLHLTSLRPWSDIPELRDVSGIGTYTASVTLPDQWSGGRCATLDLGTVGGTCRLTVNGRALPPVDQIKPVVDLTGYLRPGVNSLQVEVATTLRNRLRTIPEAQQSATPRQQYGLIGPVTLTPYGEADLK